MMKKLTSKQRRFCEEYAVDMNGTQAAIRAGYSPPSAAITATQNMRKPNIAAEISKLMMKKAERCNFDADSIFNALVEIASIDIDGVETNAKFSDKLKALEMLARHCSFFNDKMEVKQTGEPQHVFYWPENGRENVPPVK